MTPWTHVNHQLLAKAISELHFEEVVEAVLETENLYRLSFQSGVNYKFRGRMSAWGHLWVDPTSITRNGESELTAAQFFIDSLEETQMGEITLGTFLEEMNSTLYSDLQQLEQNKSTVGEMSSWDGEKLQHALTGHPKLLLNKGRMGWGSKDLADFSPEMKNQFQLHWILVRRERLTGSAQGDWSVEESIKQSFEGVEEEKLLDKIKSFSLKEYSLMPVHPWQWENIVTLQFQSELQTKNMIDLGVGGDLYSPQVSIRTLSNVNRPKNHDIKLPLSILNTSCVRGLPQKYLAITPALSNALVKLIEADKELAHVQVLSEIAAFGYVHPYYHQVKEASYRYHEQLGAVWRQSVQGKIANNEQAILAAALFHRDETGATLLSAYAKKSNLSVESWMSEYTKQVILPLYHLQLKYGVGLVAHGQNVVVLLKDGKPSGLFLKDFHGDLRLSRGHNDLHQKNFPEISKSLMQLQPEHMIHDLITGHFITVLRFMAGALEDSNAMTEKKFYQVVGSEIEKYAKEHSDLIKPETNILAPYFQRVLVNKVRFKIGYGDSSERPLPMLGSQLKNPLHQEKE